MQPTEAAAAFLDAIKVGKIDGAYDKLMAGSQLLADQPKAVETTKKQTKTQLTKFGEILGYELLDERHYGESLDRLIYLVKSAKQPTVWIFHFYRPKKDWGLISVTFGDQLGVLESL
jgi:hypothetical protein